jgi:hypothetical protein
VKVEEMSASKLPVVSEQNGHFAITIAPNTVLRWWFELRNSRIHCIIKVDLPDGLKRYEVHVDGEQDLISFPLVH